MTASWRPDLYFGVSFNADPADPGAVPIWSDLTSRFRIGGQFTRGRQYELNETQGSQPVAAFQDVDEYLNPANTSSPYYPNVIPNRQFLFQAIWPQSTAGNMLNTSAPVPSQPPTQSQSMVGVSYDGSFEGYTTGATVPWLEPVGDDIVDPVVSTTTPRSGSKDVTYTVAVTNGVQGMMWPVPCVPGRQYTSSAYVRQDAANTQTIQVIDQNQVIDGFNRTTSSGWGTADYGGAWTVAGTAANYSTSVGAAATPWLGTAVQSNAATNVIHTAVAGSCVDSIQRVLITAPVLATGAEYYMGLVSRYADANNYYIAELQFNINSTVAIRLQKRVAGTNTVLTAVTLPFTYAAGSQVWLHFETSGLNGLRAWAWADGQVPPLNFDVASDAGLLVDDVDTALTATGAVGAYSILASTNTNSLPVALTFQQYSATGSVVGTNTTTTGSYVRLSVTWTATQPIHYVQVATQEVSSLAATVFVDDIQHEEAASASTFTTTGPVLYGVFRGYVDRWPSVWQNDSQGFEGIAAITLTDVFSLLTRFGMLAAYPAAVQATNPAFWWPLWDESGSTTFAEVTGSGPPLVLKVSKYGANVAPDAGQPLNILGDPGGTGVLFTPSDAVVADNKKPGTILAAGPFVGPTSPAVTLPLVIGSGWAMTIAFWGSTVNDQISNFDDFVVPLSPVNNSNTTTPLSIYSDLGVLYRNLSGGSAFTLSTGIGGTTINDGIVHHWVGVAVQDATNITLTLYIDGVQVATNTASNASKGGILSQQATTFNVGGFNNNVSFGSVVNGSMGHVSVWNRALTATEVSNLYQAGTGWSGETSAQRINRYLTGETMNASFGVAGAYNGPTDIDFNALSVMGPDVLTTGTDALTGCQAVATTENGLFWAAPTNLAFSGREFRYLETSSTYTFGENTVGGEYPYQPNIGFDYDLTLVYNPVKVTNADGIVATAGDTTFARRFSAQSYSRDVNVLDDNEAIDAANYLLNQHKQPTQRVETILLNPAAYPTLWPLVLTIEEGMRVTVKRRAKAANSGVGFTMSADYFVEKISHDSIDMEASTWLTSIQLTPVDVSQVWILENTTYGVLDSTTILGY